MSAISPIHDVVIRESMRKKTALLNVYVHTNCPYTCKSSVSGALIKKRLYMASNTFVDVRETNIFMVEGNTFVNGCEHVRDERRTCLHTETNVIAHEQKHGYTQKQTHVRYTLHLSSAEQWMCLGI